VHAIDSARDIGERATDRYEQIGAAIDAAASDVARKAQHARVVSRICTQLQ